MPTSFKIDLNESYIYTIASGDYNLKIMQNMIRESISFAKKCSIGKMLFDCIRIKGSATTMDLFLLATLLSDLHLQAKNLAKFRAAFVSITLLKDSNSFMENVAFNRGTPLYITDKIQDAISWLERE